MPVRLVTTLPCLGCGGTVTADPEAPGPGVLVHVRGERHAAWSGRIRRTCQDCRMVTIPAHRERCHGCTRTRARVGGTP